MKRRKPFAAFRRDVLPHLRKMSPQAWKVYSALHLSTRDAEVKMTLDGLADGCGMSRTATHRALKELIPYYVTKPGNGLLVIERYGLDWTDDGDATSSAGGKSDDQEFSAGGKSDGQESSGGGKSDADDDQEISAGGKSDADDAKISAGGKFDGQGISAGGTGISAGGKSTPYMENREENISSSNGSREGEQSERDGLGSDEQDQPASPWAPWSDAEALRDAILERYPNGGLDRAGARIAWQHLIGLDASREEPQVPKMGKRMFAAASVIAEQCPPEKIGFLPSARKFFEGRYEDDWPQILERWKSEAKQGKRNRRDEDFEYRIERRRTGLR